MRSLTVFVAALLVCAQGLAGEPASSATFSKKPSMTKDGANFKIEFAAAAPTDCAVYILDAGGGNVCVVDVGAATAYVGEDGPDAIAALLGVRVSVADAVAALLDGVSPPGLALTRAGGADGTLPDTLRIEDGARALAIDRVRVERGRTDPLALGTGLPPDHLRLRPLMNLARDAAREPAPAGGER